MPYEYLDNFTTADVAFRAWDETLEKTFIAASDALLNVMVEDLTSIAERERFLIELEDETVEMLLYQLLSELLYKKDADGMLLRILYIEIHSTDNQYKLSAQVYGEKINYEKHTFALDVKAVTLHKFKVEQTPLGFEATVVLDV